MGRIASGLERLHIGKVLGSILLLALFLRLAGIAYGLPLWLVDDEPPFTLGALQMLQLHTLLPVFHQSAFAVLYYAPYLCYLYLIPFIVIAGFTYVFHAIPHVSFASVLVSDLSLFFLAARVISVMAGVLCVYLVYRIAETLFNAKSAGYASAFLLATSISHIGFSMVARHWMPTTAIFLGSLFIVTRTSLSEEKKIWCVALLAGIGAGIDTTAILAVLPAFWWYVTYGKTPLVTLVTSIKTYRSLFVFVVLAIIPTLLHPGGNGFLHDVTATHTKSLSALWNAPFTVFDYSISSEPVLLALALVGLLYALYRERRFALLALLWWLSYITIFVLVFRLEPRFFIPMTAVYALLGGLVIGRVLDTYSKSRALVLVLLAIPFSASCAFALHAFMGDTREAARTFVLEHLTPSDKVLVYAPLTRLPGNNASVEELKTIEPGALRKADGAEEELNRTDIPHALNLYTVTNKNFLNDLPAYATKNGYQYLLFSYDEYMGDAETYLGGIRDNALPVATWRGSADFSISHSRFVGSFTELFTPSMLGPTVTLYKLKP